MHGDVFDKAVADITIAGGGGTFFCSNKNNALNNVTPCKVGSLTKKGAKRKSPSVEA